MRIGLKHYIENEIKHLDCKIKLIFREHDKAIRRARKIVDNKALTDNTRMTEIENKVLQVQKITWLAMGIWIVVQLVILYILKK